MIMIMIIMIIIIIINMNAPSVLYRDTIGLIPPLIPNGEGYDASAPSKYNLDVNWW